MYNTIVITDNTATFFGMYGAGYPLMHQHTITNIFKFIEEYNDTSVFAPAHPITSIIYL